MKLLRTWLVVAGFAIAAPGLFTSPPTVLAADVTATWSTATSGNWNADANWTNVPALGGFPNNGNGGVATYDATISPLGAPYTVTLNTNVTLEDLLLSSANATLNHTSGTLTATGAINLTAGTFSLAGGTIANSTVNATVPISFANPGGVVPGPLGTLSGVTVNGDLSFPNNFSRALITGGTTFSTAHLSGLASEIGFAPAQTLSGTIQFEGGGGNVRYVSMSTPGSLTIGATGVIKTTAGLTGDGQIGGAGFGFNAAMALTNNGLISSQVSGRTITINPATSFANAGTLEATGGGILTISVANWTNAGTISLNAGTVNLGGTFNVTGGIGAWSNTGGTVNVTGTITNTASTLTLNNATGSWNMLGGTVSGGTLALTDGKTLNFANPGGVVPGPLGTLSGVTVNGDLSFPNNFSRALITGGTTFSTAHLSGLASEIGFAPAQTLSGTIQFEGGGGNVRYVSMSTPGSLTIGATGVIKTTAGLTGDGQIGGAGFGFNAAMALTNNGLISSQVSGRTITINPATSFANAGTLEATGGGILTISVANWTNAGTISLNAGTVNLGGTFNVTGGIGAWSNTGGTVNVTGTITNTASTLTLNNATGSWNMLGGTVSGGTLALTDGKTLNFANPGGVVPGPLGTLSGVTVNGDLSFPNNFSRALITGGTTFSTAHLSGLASEIGFAPAQTLSGTIQFEGGGGNVRYVSMSTPGSLTIGATGVIKTTAGLTGDGQIGGAGFGFNAAMALTNNGLISSQVSGRTITINPATSFANAGTLEATGGGILTISVANWTNAGTISLNAGTVNLGGTFNVTGGIGAWSNTGGTVNVTGTITNTASTLTLNNATGSWNMLGGTVSGGTLALTDGKTLNFANPGGVVPGPLGTLSGVTVNGDLSFPNNFSRALITGGTTFSTAHLSGLASEIGFAPAQTLSGTIQFEGGGGNVRYVSMSTPGSLTIGATGVIKTAAGLTGDAAVGAGLNFTGAMALTNNGLISSQVSGRTLTINPVTSFTNGGAGIVQAMGGGIVTVSSSFTNAATLEAISGGALNVPLGFTQTAGITRVNSGGTISALNLATLGAITLAGGRLEGNGTITANVLTSATIAPGLSVGTLSIAGDLTLAPASTLQIEIGGVRQGVDHDFLTEAGAAPLNLTGALSVIRVGGFLPTAADSLIILSSNQPIAGMFSNVVGGRVTATDGITSIKVSVVGTYVVLGERPGDYNGDTFVDGADFLVWQRGVGAKYTQAHLDVWKTNFGATPNSVAGANNNSVSDAPANVPEPATAVMLVVGMLAMSSRRRAAVSSSHMSVRRAELGPF